MSEENVEVVQRSIAAYNRRDCEAMRELGHPDQELDWSASLGLDTPGCKCSTESIRGSGR
jgi:ketosteroid isomerase-like protein